MIEFLRILEGALDSGDPEVKTWLLVRNTHLPFYIVGFYLLFALIIGPAVMKNRKPCNLRLPMIIHSFFIAASYALILLIIFWNLQYLKKGEFCGDIKVESGSALYVYARLFWVIYLLKYVELLDTVFGILRKKEINTYLNVVHHMLLLVVGWIFLRTEKSGTQCFVVGLNSFVHCVIYTYFGIAAIGPRVRNYLWWKKNVTQLQMIHFILIFVFVTTVAPYFGCTMTSITYFLNLTFASVYFYLFYQFYKEKFSNEDPQKKQF